MAKNPVFGPFFTVWPEGPNSLQGNPGFWGPPGHMAQKGVPKWGQNGLFSLMFAVFDLSRPLEGRYGPVLVLRRDILVVYGVGVLSSA